MRAPGAEPVLKVGSVAGLVLSTVRARLVNALSTGPGSAQIFESRGVHTGPRREHADLRRQDEHGLARTPPDPIIGLRIRRLGVRLPPSAHHDLVRRCHAVASPGAALTARQWSTRCRAGSVGRNQDDRERRRVESASGSVPGSGPDRRPAGGRPRRRRATGMARAVGVALACACLVGTATATAADRRRRRLPATRRRDHRSDGGGGAAAHGTGLAGRAVRGGLRRARESGHRRRRRVPPTTITRHASELQACTGRGHDHPVRHLRRVPIGSPGAAGVVHDQPPEPGGPLRHR